MTTTLADLKNTYDERKERYMKDDIPFMCYLHTSGWMFMRLDEVPLTLNEDPDKPGMTISAGPRAKKGFDKIVNQLRKQGVLLDVTYYLPEAVTTRAL